MRELIGGVAGKRCELEVEKFVDIERAGLVLLVEAQVLGLVGIPLEDAVIDQELRPFVVAVPAEEGIVEIKQ